jgi:acylphosphatase
MEQLKRVRIVATGYVQGVFFRDSLRREAARLHVTGWARNRADGAVEAELQGESLAVDEAVEFCRRGPGRAEVEALTVSDISTVEDETAFEIR